MNDETHTTTETHDESPGDGDALPKTYVNAPWRFSHEGRNGERVRLVYDASNGAGEQVVEGTIDDANPTEWIRVLDDEGHHYTTGYNGFGDRVTDDVTRDGRKVGEFVRAVRLGKPRGDGGTVAPALELDRDRDLFAAHPDVDIGDEVLVEFDTRYYPRMSDEKTILGRVTYVDRDIRDGDDMALELYERGEIWSISADELVYRGGDHDRRVGKLRRAERDGEAVGPLNEPPELDRDPDPVEDDRPAYLSDGQLRYATDHARGAADRLDKLADYATEELPEVNPQSAGFDGRLFAAIDAIEGLVDDLETERERREAGVARATYDEGDGDGGSDSDDDPQGSSGEETDPEPRAEGDDDDLDTAGDSGAAPRGGFEVGDRTVDADDDDEPGEQIVIDPDAGPIREIEVEATGSTIADYNPEYDPDERGVTVVFVEWLDRNVPRWPALLDADEPFDEALEAYGDEWSIPIQSYTYPESRLDAVANED